MDKNKRKELKQIYKDKRPEMGVISYRCIETGESFLGISRDTKSEFNSTNMKLNARMHPNRRLQDLWNKYGLEGFEPSVIKTLKYDDPEKDYTKKLEDLRDQCLAADPSVGKIWR